MRLTTLSTIRLFTKTLLPLGIFTVQIAGAATITVSTTADSGPGSLRAALESAANGDTINFSVTGAILLTSDELAINNSLTVAGPGPANLAVDANLTSRVFYIGAPQRVHAGPPLPFWLQP